MLRSLANPGIFIVTLQPPMGEQMTTGIIASLGKELTIGERF